MTQINAKMASARLEIWVPFSDSLMIVASDYESLCKALSDQLPKWHCKITPWGLGQSPEYSRFVQKLDWDTIRAEFSRKAKKLGLSVPEKCDVSIKNGKDGVLLYVYAKGRA